jgi:CBS domain-containing protein
MESCMELPAATLESNEEDSILANPIRSAHRRIQVGEVMSKGVITVSPHQDIIDAALKMAEAGISCVIVTVGDDVVGILTETDFRKMVVAQGDSIYQTKVTDVMSGPVVSASADLSVLDASRMMQDRQVRRLPVLDGKQLVGIVTQTDLTRALTSFEQWRDVGDLMSETVYEIQIGASIVAAAELMNVSKISSVIVTSEDDVLGVLTQRDILKKVIAEEKDPKATRVEEIMSSPLISVAPTCSLFSASKTMADLNIRRLVVMDDRTVCGIITQTDVFKAIENKLQTEKEEKQRLHQAIRSEATAKALNMATVVLLLGGITIAGIVMAILW